MSSKWMGMLLLLIGNIWAHSDHYDNPRFTHLVGQLRCLVCQNETVLDSQSLFANSLRTQVYSMMQQGKSDAAIEKYLIERYGTFILYNPPMNRETSLLWGAPLLPLVLGWYGYRKRKKLIPKQ